MLTGALPVLYALAQTRSRWRWTPVVCDLLLGLAILTKAVAVFVLPAVVPPLLAGAAGPGRLGAPRELVLFAAGAAACRWAWRVFVRGRRCARRPLVRQLHVQPALRRCRSRRLLPIGRAGDLEARDAGRGRRHCGAGRSARALAARGTLLLWLAGAAVGAQLSGRGFRLLAPVLVAGLRAPVRADRRAPGPRCTGRAQRSPRPSRHRRRAHRRRAVSRAPSPRRSARPAVSWRSTSSGCRRGPWVAQYAVGSDPNPTLHRPVIDEHGPPPAQRGHHRIDEQDRQTDRDARSPSATCSLVRKRSSKSSGPDCASTPIPCRIARSTTTIARNPTMESRRRPR